MSDFARDDREPLTFSVAQPGWRALFVEAIEQTSHFTIPLVGWSVFRITVRDRVTGDQLPQARTQIEGVVQATGVDSSQLVSVFAYEPTSAEFWWYLSPDEPDPEPGTVPGQEPDGKGKGGKTNGGKGGRGRGRGRSPVFEPRPASKA